MKDLSENYLDILNNLEFLGGSGNWDYTPLIGQAGKLFTYRFGTSYC
jgi:hypothetical protein